jgi:hypothetical protein
MAMLSLSVSCIHLELSAAKIFKGTSAPRLSMILFQGGRKMAELCATRMELDYAFVEFPLFSRGLPRVSTASSRCQSDCTFQVIAPGSMSQSGQYAKSSLRADVFRFAPNIGRYSAAQFMGSITARAVGHPVEGKALRPQHSPPCSLF